MKTEENWATLQIFPFLFTKCKKRIYLWASVSMLLDCVQGLVILSKDLTLMPFSRWSWAKVVLLWPQTEDSNQFWYFMGSQRCYQTPLLIKSYKILIHGHKNGFEWMFFRKKVLGQLEPEMKILLLTVLTHPGEISKGYAHEKIQPVVNLWMDCCSHFKH